MMYCCVVVWLLLAVAAVVRAQGIQEIFAVVTQSTELPCDIASGVEGDSVLLVVWYKDEMLPIYSYDSRSRGSEQGTHWKAPDSMAGRAHFRTITEPAKLSIETVEESDAGNYRCRVDFHKSPTRNHRMNLTVIVPPQKPTIFDDKGSDVQGIAGPYQEGEEVTLVCVVSGGRPTPTVRWWRESMLVDATDAPSSFPGVMENQLILPKISRNDLRATYTCQASNTNITAPVQSSVSLDLYLKPLSVKIIVPTNSPFSAGRKVDILCEAVGSTPPANISWWKDNRMLHNLSAETSPDGNVTTSNMTFIPAVEDHGKRLTCRADNEKVAGGAEEDSLELNVFYVPIIHLELGSNLNPEAIREGTDVYFECRIKTNPAAYKVVWKHNGIPLQHNQKGGVIISDKALALQSVRRDQAGAYSCMAYNVEGDGTSNIVHLQVMYKPICKAGQKLVYGIARHEEAHILCEVDASPPPTTFRWAFNNTAETIDVAEGKFESNLRHRSSLLYRPQSELDYGTVMCWATNVAGQQAEPCVFHIIAAGHPDSPFNCTILNQTSSSLGVECLPGFDGGQQQWFQLETWDAFTNQVLMNMSNRLPSFVLTQLIPGQTVRLAITAVNNKGRSESVILEGFTLKVEKQTVLASGSPASIELPPVLGYLLAGAVLLATAILASCVVLRKKKLRRPMELPLKEKVALDMDDRNPDVVPSNKDADYQLVSEGLVQETVQNNNNSAIIRNGGIYERHPSRPSSTELLSSKSLQFSHEITYAELCGSKVPSEGPTLRRPPDREVVTVRTPLMHQQESCV